MPTRPATGMRAGLGVAAGALLALLGGLILGEQELLGAIALVAAAGLGLVMGELMTAVGGVYPRWGAVVAGALAGAGFAYAVWISSGRGLVPVDLPARLGPAIAAAAAAFTLRSSARRGAGSRSDS